MSRFGAFFVLLAVSAAHGQEPKELAPYFRPPGLMGTLHLPDGTSYPLTLDVRFRKDRTFTGTFSYQVGLRAHSYEVEGAADEKGRITLHKKRDICTALGPMLGGGKFEARGNEDQMGGVVYMRGMTEGTDNNQLPQPREIKCTFGVIRWDCLARQRWWGPGNR
jgi:hypothetical protein